MSSSAGVSQRAQAMLDFEAKQVVPPSGGVFSSGEYNAQTNPNALINMSTAENRLVFDLLKEKLNSCLVPPKMWADDMFMYSATEGVAELRDAVAKFLTVTARADKPLDPNKMVIVNGADGGLEAMGQVLCDPGEAVLLPVPYYYGLHRSLKIRIDVNIVPIPLTAEPAPGDKQAFELTADKAEMAYQKAIREGTKVKALFLVNPNNPLGDVYTRQQLLDLLQFAKRHDLHVVFDEVYMNTIYEDGVTHHSILQFREDEIPDLQKVHFVWTFSKDLAMGGMRLSVNYTWNEDVRRVLTSIAHFQCCPTGWQQMMARLLDDTDWFVNVFLPTSVGKLKEAHTYFTKRLLELGVSCHKGTAGLYVWADFSKFLTAPTVEAELALNQKFLQAGVQFTPSATCSGMERGWFRIVFPRRRDILDIALQRLQSALQL